MNRIRVIDNRTGKFINSILSPVQPRVGECIIQRTDKTTGVQWKVEEVVYITESKMLGLWATFTSLLVTQIIIYVEVCPMLINPDHDVWEHVAVSKV